MNSKTAVTDQTTAVILETIPATYGMPIPPPDYLPWCASFVTNTGRY